MVILLWISHIYVELRGPIIFLKLVCVGFYRDVAIWS